MLAAIRERLAASAPFDAVRSQHGAPPAVANRGERVAAIAPALTNTLTERFCEALETVSAHCVVVHDEREAATALQKIIEQKNVRRLAGSDSPLVQQVMGSLRHEAERLEIAT